MAIATPEVYAEMLENAKAKGFAYPAVNVTSSQTLNAAIRGFAEAGSDGIVQASTGGAAYWSGASKKDMVVGSLAFAAYAREVAKQYAVNIALHTHKAKIVLEVEIGAVGGEEDGVEGAIDDTLYTTVDDAVKTVEALGLGEKGRYIAALTFGNVHGVYKPGNVHLRPELLKQIQDEIGAKYIRPPRVGR